MKKIEVGTEVCAVHHVSYRNEYSYYFTKVVKLTAKRATLENGDVIIIEPKDSRFESFGKSKFGYYKIVTPEILADHASIEQKKKIERWFDAQKFTFEQKKKIYNLLNIE